MALAGPVSRLQPKAAAGAAHHRMPRVSRPPTSTLGTPAASTLRGLQMFCSPYPPKCSLHLNCTAPWALAGRVSRLQPKAVPGAARHGIPRVPRDQFSTLGSPAASSPRRLHVLRSPYPPESGLHSHCTLGICRARQPPAAEDSCWRCPSRDASGPQGGEQHPKDARCIQPTRLARVALALPTGIRPSLSLHPWHLQGLSAACNQRQRMALHVTGCLGSPGTRPAP